MDVVWRFLIRNHRVDHGLLWDCQAKLATDSRGAENEAGVKERGVDVLDALERRLGTGGGS